jgi:hypothetical protein
MPMLSERRRARLLRALRELRADLRDAQWYRGNSLVRAAVLRVLREVERRLRA